jgi:hypothetical protein
MIKRRKRNNEIREYKEKKQQKRKSKRVGKRIRIRNRRSYSRKRTEGSEI